jgi:hypothetical protein
MVIWDQADLLQETWDQDQMDLRMDQMVNQWDLQRAIHQTQMVVSDQDQMVIWDQADLLQVEIWDQDQIHCLVIQGRQADHLQGICLQAIQWGLLQAEMDQWDLHQKVIWDQLLQWMVWMKCIHIWMMQQPTDQQVQRVTWHHHQKVIWEGLICLHHHLMILVMT